MAACPASIRRWLITAATAATKAYSEAIALATIAENAEVG